MESKVGFFFRGSLGCNKVSVIHHFFCEKRKRPFEWNTLQGMSPYPTLGKGKSSTQKVLAGRGYVSVREGNDTWFLLILFFVKFMNIWVGWWGWFLQGLGWMSLSQCSLLYINDPRKNFKWWLFFRPFWVMSILGTFTKDVQSCSSAIFLLPKPPDFPWLRRFSALGFPTLCQKTCFLLWKYVWFKIMVSASRTQVSSDQNPRWLGSIGIILPSFIGIIISQCEDPIIFYQTSISWFHQKSNGALPTDPVQ